MEKTPKNYLMIKNSIVDKLATVRLSAYETNILFAIFRKTYGYVNTKTGERKTEDYISHSQFAEMTNMKIPHVSRTLSKLIKRNIILRKQLPKGVITYAINKNTDSWLELPKGVSTHHLPKGVTTLTQGGNSLLPKGGTTKENTTKENVTKEILPNGNTAKQYGNPLINEISAYFLETMGIPQEDCSIKVSRQYWNLLIKASKSGVAGVKWLIDLASQDEFYKNNITSSKDLYYKRMKLVTRKRGDIPKVAVMKGGVDDVENNNRDKPLLANGAGKGILPAGIISGAKIRSSANWKGSF